MTPMRRALAMYGTQRKLAEAMGVSFQAVSFWLTGARRVSAECAVKIEAITNGQVKRAELRPDLFGPLTAPPPASGSRPERIGL